MAIKGAWTLAILVALMVTAVPQCGPDRRSCHCASTCNTWAETGRSLRGQSPVRNNEDLTT